MTNLPLSDSDAPPEQAAEQADASLGRIEPLHGRSIDALKDATYRDMADSRPLWSTHRLVTAYLMAAVAIAILGWIIREPPGYALCAGIAAGQVALLGAWLALGTAPWLVRVVEVALASSTLLIDVWLLEPMTLAGAGFEIMVLALVVGGVALMFLVLRAIFSWRLVAGAGNRPPRPRQFTIRHVLAATTAIALLAAAARTWETVLAGLLFVLGSSAVFAPAPGLIGFALAEHRRPLYLIPSALVAAGWLVAALFDDPGPEGLVIFLLAYVTAHGVALVLFMQLRAEGYRLQAALPWRRGTIENSQREHGERT